MNRTGLNISALKTQFAFYLEQLEDLNPVSFHAMSEFLIDLGEKIQALVEKTDRTEEEQQQIELLIPEIQKFIGHLAEAQLGIRKREWADTKLYYERLQKEASEGDEDAKKALEEFKPVYFQMLEQMNSDADIDFPSSSSLKFLTANFKL